LKALIADVVWFFIIPSFFATYRNTKPIHPPVRRKDGLLVDQGKKSLFNKKASTLCFRQQHNDELPKETSQDANCFSQTGASIHLDEIVRPC
jgi:hypothetical protein